MPSITYYGVRLVNMDLTHWFSTEAEQLAFAARCGFQYALVTMTRPSV